MKHHIIKLSKLHKSEVFKKARFSRANLTIFAIIFAVIGGYLIYSSFAAGATYYMSPAGSGTACTQAAPCSSMNNAYHTASPGDTVLMATGTYPANQNITADATKAGADSQTPDSARDVTFKPASGANVIIDGFTHHTYTTNDTGSLHVGTTQTGGTVTHITIQDVTFNGYVEIDSARNFHLKRTTHYGKIFSMLLSYVSIEDGEITFPNGSEEAHAIEMHDPNGNEGALDGTNILIKGMRIHNIHMYLPRNPSENGPPHPDGIHTYGRYDNVQIIGNNFWNNECINLRTSPTWNNALVVNNVFGPTYGQIPESDCGYVAQVSGTNTTFRYNSLGGLFQADPTTSNSTFEGNIGLALWDGTCNFKGSNIIERNNVCPDSLATLKYVNATSGATNDMHLQAGSPAIEAGNTANFPATDLDGNPRPAGAKPDAGAYEYGSSNNTANLWVDTNGGSCTRTSTPAAYIDAQACSSFNAAWQAASATANDVIRVKTGSYGTQSLLTRSTQPTCNQRGTNNTGVRFVMEGDPTVNGINFGDEAVIGASNQSVKCITVTGAWHTTNTLNFAFASDITIEDATCDINFASKKCAFWKGQTNRTTIRRSDFGNVHNEKLMESIIFEGSTSNANPSVEANSNILLEDSKFHSVTRDQAGTGGCTADPTGCHVECFLAPAVPGLTLIRTQWYSCSSTGNFNFGAYAGMTDVSQDNFHFVNNIFESPTNNGLTDKTYYPWFQGCNAPTPGTKTGWVVEYNIMESGWYFDDSYGCGDTGLIYRGNISRTGGRCPGGTVTFSILDRACTGTGNQNVATASIFSTSNFTNINSHNWTYPAGAFQIDKGDISNYPVDDITKAARYAGAAPDAGPYEYGAGGGVTPPPPPPDPTPPTVSITTPTTGATVSGSSVTLSANASDNVGVAGVQFKVDGNSAGAEDTTSPYSITWDSFTVANGSHSVTATARDAAGNSTTSSSVSITVANSGSFTIGETTITSADDNGNANLLLAQQTTLNQSASIQSLSFYVTTAVGKLRLGIYDATGPSGGPGTKVAETAEITPTTGWNTAATTTHPTLNAGSYWLAYLPSDNNLGFRKSATSSTPSRYYSFTYGTLPNTYSTSPTTTASHWSFYATLTIGGSSAKVGDINNDNVVNITDLSLLLSSYGQNTTQCITNTNLKCDLSTPGDGVVNIFDLSILLSKYGS